MRDFLKRLMIVGFVGIVSVSSFANKPSPPITTTHSQVTLTEYYDDECPHCHRMGSLIEELKAAYPSLILAYRATPILNTDSWAVASLVEAAGNKKIALHETMVSEPQIPTIAEVLDVASRLGIDKQALLTSAKSLSVHNSLENNIKAAEKQSSLGTVALPLFVFSSNNKKSQAITLIGEQPYALLSAVVKQLEE